MYPVTNRDRVWWNLLRLNCTYRNCYGKCINRSKKYSSDYIRCEAQGCPLLRKTRTIDPHP